VSDADLIDLYRSAALFVFPSLHEGFGLPVLEAMACGALVIGADSTSIPEVIGSPEALFDPRQPAAIAAKIGQVLDDGLAGAPARARRRRPANSAGTPARNARSPRWKRTWRRVRPHAASRPGRRPRRAAAHGLRVAAAARAHRRRRLRGARAAHAAAALRDRADRRPGRRGAAAGAQRTCRCIRPPGSTSIRTATDHIVYQFGNSPFHSHMIALLQRHPGVVVLHDFFLSSMLCTNR
jgi:hypothetical protein